MKAGLDIGGITENDKSHLTAGDEQMLRVAHRGASGFYLENSLAAFSHARDLRVEAVEFDVQATRDGQLVVFHDKLLNRTSSGQGRLSSYTFSELTSTVKLLNGEPIPTLHQVLNIFSNTDTKVYMEIITRHIGLRATLEALQAMHVSQLVVSSFHHKEILEVKTSVPELCTMALFECSPVDPLRLIRSCRADEAGIGFDSASDELARDLGTENIPLYFYTINQSDDVETARALGASGIFTDYLFSVPNWT
jgi:glycerophosphoryl diester phosphodiesterase